jgi:hypothetical protein
MVEGTIEEPQLSQYSWGEATRNVTGYVRRVVAWAKFRSLIFNNIWYLRAECKTSQAVLLSHLSWNRLYSCRRNCFGRKGIQDMMLRQNGKLFSWQPDPVPWSVRPGSEVVDDCVSVLGAQTTGQLQSGRNDRGRRDFNPEARLFTAGFFFVRLLSLCFSNFYVVLWSVARILTA